MGRTVLPQMMERAGIVAPPCNDPACRRCDPTRLRLRAVAEAEMRRQIRVARRRRLSRR